MSSVSLSQFRQIASGTYNVGDVCINDQNQLEKVNNHVHLQSRNIKVLSTSQNIAVRTALFKALSNDQRMNSDMQTKIEGLLLGDNAVRSLSRREIKLYLTALDSGSAEALEGKVNYFHERSQSTSLNTSFEKIIFEHTVNENLDMARMEMQRARQFHAQIGVGASPTEQRDYSADMKKAWNAFTDSVADYCAQDKKGLNPEAVKNTLLARYGDDAFSKLQTAGEARQALKAMFADALSFVPDQFRREASIVAVWEKGDAGGIDVTQDEALTFFAPSTLNKLNWQGEADSVNPEPHDLFGAETDIPLNDVGTETFNELLAEEVQTAKNNPENGKALFMVDADRGGLTYHAGGNDLGTSGEGKANDILEKFDHFFAEDGDHGDLARNILLRAMNQMTDAVVMQSFALTPEMRGVVFGQVNETRATDYNLTREPDGSYRLDVKENFNISMFGSPTAPTTQIVEHLQKDTSGEQTFSLKLTFSATGEPTLSLLPGAKLHVRLPPRNLVEDGDKLHNDIITLEDLQEQAADLEGRAVFDNYSRKQCLSELEALEKRVEMEIDVLTTRLDDEKRKKVEKMEPHEIEPWQKSLSELPRAISDSKNLLDRVRTNKKRVQDQIAMNPLSYKNVLSCVKDWSKAATVLYSHLCNTYGLQDRPDIRSEIYLELPSFDDVKDLNDDCPDPERYLKGIASKFEKKLAHFLKLQGKKVDVKDVIKPLLQEAWKGVLEHKDWKTIERDLVFKFGDESVTAKSTIAPALQIPGFKENLKPDISLQNPEDDTYGKANGKNGLVSHNTTTAHANNMACSTFTRGGRTLFSGIRTAVWCAFGIKDAQKRKLANINRAKEAITAAALTNDRLLELVENSKGERCRFNLLLTSTSLLTPDLLRDTLSVFFEDSDERMMVKEHYEACKAVDGVSMTIKVPKKNGELVEVDVTPNILMFNFGVNAGAVNTAPAITVGGWDVSDKINDESLPKLREQVNFQLMKLDGQIHSPQKGDDVEELKYRKETITTLMEQIEAIHNAKAERKDGNDAYKIVSRINVLSSLLGGKPAWNCKSGKDRTGELDVESKFLSLLIDMKMPIPEPGAKLTPEQKAIFDEIVQDGGNFEMQMYNTGAGGFKTADVDSIPERMGEAAQLHKGLSPFVKV